ncbi:MULTISPECIES: 2-hydroxyacid dehydrogenase [Spirosoma]|uniref:2-hydroxyacid dehydrogenase n=1 Tax=Spirosoma sordidisoli TaxID=2502893 RepID=A0A4Q2UCW3_9BACT|nr:MULTISPECIES: 2-hydroxyacid dehydrogenase [Spirosoma]RYC66887.1 2-hydroxyacid dehydrogenase [Spirosoma sordidisoli]
MTIAFYSAQPFEQRWFDELRGHHQITYIPEALTLETASKAAGHQAVCAFVNDDLSRPVLQQLRRLGIGVLGMRCVGLDNVDQHALCDLDMTLLHIPGYSPFSVAEQAIGLLLGLIRHLPEAHNRVTTGNFSINGLVGTDLHGKTVGVIGTGRIGKAFLHIVQGFGCKVLAYDIGPDRRLVESGVVYVPLRELLQQADIVSLHCALTPLTTYLINAKTLPLLKPGAFLVNTGRGKLVHTEALLDALDAGQLAGYAADVYEGERTYFHYDYADQPITDALLNRLRTHPRVLLTAHQGFLTDEALRQIARSMLNQFSFYDNQQTALITRASMC